MKTLLSALALTLLASACTTTAAYDVASLPNKDTGDLCRIVAENPDQNFRRAAAELLVKRGTTVERCRRLIQSDKAMLAAAVAVGGAALAAGAASSGGGYYPSYGSYGVAWDQFYNEYYQLIWRCRDRSNGQFVPDTYCSGQAMVDSTWPGWSA